MRGKILALVGPSGIGKTTLISQLVDVRGKFCRVLNTTTRPKRDYEINGRDYRFLTEEGFADMRRHDVTLEETLVEFGGHKFAVSLAEMANVLRSGRIALVEMYMSRVTKFRVQFSEDFLAIYLLPGSLETLAHRLHKFRQHDDEFIAGRMAQTERELDLLQREKLLHFDSMITPPDELVAAVNQLEQLIYRLIPLVVIPNC
ncbi:hypothetical protein ACFL0Z_02625 [Patescibacteria group bacterium]